VRQILPAWRGSADAIDHGIAQTPSPIAGVQEDRLAVRTRRIGVK
jgi:hypothetical protein